MVTVGVAVVAAVSIAEVGVEAAATLVEDPADSAVAASGGKYYFQADFRALFGSDDHEERL